MNYAPIVLLTYKRLTHTKRVIDALRVNALAGESSLFVFADAPKSENDKKDVESVKKYIYTINGFKSVTCIEREVNYGLAKNMTHAVTDIVARFGKIIVLEDDDMPAPFFLKFMNDALEKYSTNEKVMHIGGYMFPINAEGLPQTVFHRLTSSWGWATWDRAWKFYDSERDARKLMRRFNWKMIRQFNFDDAALFWSQLRGNKRGKLNTWSIFWYAAVFLQGGLCLHPSRSLIQNIGMDSSGENCDTSTQFLTTLNLDTITDFEDDVSENPLLLERLKKYFGKNKPSIISRLLFRLRTHHIM